MPGQAGPLQGSRPVHDQDLADRQAGGERILAVGRTLSADQGFGSSAQVAAVLGASTGRSFGRMRRAGTGIMQPGGAGGCGQSSVVVDPRDR